MDIADKANLEVEVFERLLSTVQHDVQPSNRELEVQAFTNIVDGLEFLHTNGSLSDVEHDTLTTVLLQAAQQAVQRTPTTRMPSIANIGHREGTLLTSIMFSTDGDRTFKRNELMGAEYEDKLQ